MRHSLLLLILVFGCGSTDSGLKQVMGTGGNSGTGGSSNVPLVATGGSAATGATGGALATGGSRTTATAVTGGAIGTGGTSPCVRPPDAPSSITNWAGAYGTNLCSGNMTTGTASASFYPTGPVQQCQFIWLVTAPGPAYCNRMRIETADGSTPTNISIAVMPAGADYTKACNQNPSPGNCLVSSESVWIFGTSDVGFWAISEIVALDRTTNACPLSC